VRGGVPLLACCPTPCGHPSRCPQPLAPTTPPPDPAGAPRHWRLRAASTGAGAFAGLRVLLHGAFDAPDADVLARAVAAGGGAVLRRGPPFAAEDMAAPEEGGVHVAVVAPRKGAGDK
jgi:hypothetical protein